MIRTIPDFCFKCGSILDKDFTTVTDCASCGLRSCTPCTPSILTQHTKMSNDVQKMYPKHNSYKFSLLREME